MRPVERLRSEQQFHDRQARARAHALCMADYRFTDASYLGHATWIRPAFARLGDVRGRRVLDLGCGHGMAAVVLARRGAHVTACDLSLGYLEEAQTRALANEAEIDCVKANGEELPFADAAFDRIWGNAILHHLDLGKAAPELHRVLRPGGSAVFCEPWGENRLLDWARRSCPYPGKERTPDEEPLRESHLLPLRHSFPNLDIAGYQLLAMASRLLPSRPLERLLSRCDDRIFALAPALKRYCRYVVITATR